jgi:hypothetical protein
LPRSICGPPRPIRESPRRIRVFRGWGRCTANWRGASPVVEPAAPPLGLDSGGGGGGGRVLVEITGA